MTSSESPMTVGTLLAPLYFGLLFAIGFEGILISQWYTYWKTYYDKDPIWFQGAVHALGYIFRIKVTAWTLTACASLLEIFHSAMIVHAGYWYLMVLWGRDDQLDSAVWSLLTELALTVLVSFVGRSFWILWLIRLTRNWWIIGIAGCFALAQLVLGILEVFQAIRAPFFSTLVGNEAIVVVQMVAGHLSDVITAAGLTYYLHRNRTGYKPTELVLDRLMRFIVTRGLLAVVLDAGQLITFVIWPRTFYFGAFHLMFSKVYTNALLATLNGRDYIAAPLAQPHPGPGSHLTSTSLSFASVAPASPSALRLRTIPEETTGAGRDVF